MDHDFTLMKIKIEANYLLMLSITARHRSFHM